MQKKLKKPRWNELKIAVEPLQRNALQRNAIKLGISFLKIFISQFFSYGKEYCSP